MTGSKFCKCDLHIHTPASFDYKDKDVTPDDIVKTAIDKGLDAIAITDHNSFDWVDKVVKAAEGESLVVFPGVEITANGGHILALFDPDVSVEKIKTLLTKVDIYEEDYGKEETLGASIENVLEQIHTLGGVAIAAHADAPKGFLTSTTQGQARINVFNNQYLSAMEVTKEVSVDKYSRGNDPNYSRPLACIQNSDAHSLNDIGKRYSLLKMHRINTDGLFQVFNDHRMRVVFPDNWNPRKFPFVNSIEINQGFLQGQRFEFNQNFNCLLGGAGTGKSTIIEFIRFCLDQISDHDTIKEDCFGKLRDLALIGSVITIEIVTSSGESLKIERIFDDDTNPITVIDSKGNILPGVDIRNLFPIHAYSQGEAILISRDKLSQLDLIDKHININDYEREIEDGYNYLNAQVEGLSRFEAMIKDKKIIESDISTSLAQITLTTQELSDAQKTEKNPIIDAHQFWVEEMNYLTQINQALEVTKSEIERSVDQMHLSILDISKPEDDEIPNKTLIARVHNLSQEIKQKREDFKLSILSELENLKKLVKIESDSWKPLYTMHNGEYKNALEKVGEANLQQISAKLEGYRRTLRKRQQHLQRINLAQSTFSQELEKRQEVIKNVLSTKERIITLRKRKVKEIEKKLGNKIRIELVVNGNRDKYLIFLNKELKGSRAGADVKEKICELVDPLTLAEIIRNKDNERLKAITGIDTWAERVVEHFSSNPDRLYRLEGVSLEDMLKISLEIEDGEYRELSKLSGGQKATVIVLLSMIEGESPIIFDQPEDALYTPFIYDKVVRVIRENKENRQFIFATHNSNIAIAPDLDLGIILQGSATESHIEASGALDDLATRELAILHLEGGKGAVKDRIKKLHIFDLN